MAASSNRGTGDSRPAGAAGAGLGQRPGPAPLPRPPDRLGGGGRRHPGRPAAHLQDRLESLHQAVPMTGARLRRRDLAPRPAPTPLIVDGDPLPPPTCSTASTWPPSPPSGSWSARPAPAWRSPATTPPSTASAWSPCSRPWPGCRGCGQPPAPSRPAGYAPPPGAKPQGPGVEAAPGGGRAGPELRGLVGRLVRPADRVAASLARPVREALVVREVALAGAGGDGEGGRGGGGRRRGAQRAAWAAVAAGRDQPRAGGAGGGRGRGGDGSAGAGEPVQVPAG